jgi:hypothetical protein
MSRLSWKRGYRYCDGINARGYPCGNKVPEGFRYCHAHRKMYEKKSDRVRPRG